MQLSQLEKFIARQGIFGIALSDVPKELLSQLEDSKILEIVRKDENKDFPETFLEKRPENNVFNISDVKDYQQFDLRMNLEAWRRLVYKGRKMFSASLARLIDIIITKPDGIEKTEFQQQIRKYKLTKVSEWMIDLQKYDIIKVEDNLIRYNFDWIDGSEEIPDDLFTSVHYCISRLHALNLGYEIENKSKKTESAKSSQKDTKSMDSQPLSQQMASTDELQILHSSKKPNKLPLKELPIKEQSNTKQHTSEVQAINNTDLLDTQNNTRNENTPLVASVNSLMSFDEKLELAQNEIKERKEGIELRLLKKKLKMEINEFEQLIEALKDTKEYVESGRKTAMKITYTGKLATSYHEPEMINYLIDMCTASRMFLMSELPTELVKMKETMNLDTEQFIKILEDHDFNIIEFKTQQGSSEYVVFASTVDPEDSNLLEIFEKAKESTQIAFKERIWNVFVQNVYLNAFDNHFLPVFGERVRVFYTFVIKQMIENEDYFCLNRNALCKMDFASFIRCVPFREHLQFLKIAHKASRKYEELKHVFNKHLIGDIDEIQTEVYEALNRELLKVMEHISVGNILKVFKIASEEYKSIATRINLYEFDRIITALIKYNIFEGFSTNKFLYFEKIEGITGYVDKIISSQVDEKEEPAMVVPYLVRKRFYDEICNVSEDKFEETAKRIATSQFDGVARSFFLNKIEKFM